MRLLLICLALCLVNASFAQEGDQFESKSFLIVLSTKSYNGALKKAQLACNELGYTLDLRNMYADKENGLTSSEVCGCGEQHGYLPRGRGDDGNYISIEYSDYFNGFSKGYYIIVVASGDREEVQSILPAVQEHYKDAYIKNAEVYMGCMH